MRFFIFLLSVSVLVQGNARYQPYYDDIFYPYPTYPVAEIVRPPVNFVDENRLFFQLTSLFTTTTTTTSTTTTTCTVFTALACVGRRKRFLGDDDESAVEIEPSPVNKIEVTQLAEMEPSTRNERKADPEYSFWRGGYDYPPYAIQSTFGQRPFPVSFNPYVRRPMINADPRFLFRVTSTSTTTSTVTSRSTPICSSGSGFNQC